MTHLLAELVENAVLYSPPLTRVQVRAAGWPTATWWRSRTAGSASGAAELAALNERLARPPEFDLADSDQLGLFVVSRLAARHQVKVSLRGSPYGGTAAIVLMPHHLVVAGRRGVRAGRRSGHRRDEHGRHHAGSAGSWPRLEPAITVATLLVPAAATGRAPRTVRRQPCAAEPFASGRPSPAAALAAPTCRAGSARPAWRRSSGRPAQARPGPAATDGRSAEEARALLSSIQQGWRSGRAEAGQADGMPGRRSRAAGPATRRGRAMTGGSPPGDLNWLLEHLITTVDRVRQAVISSPDGLTMGDSPGLSPDDADHLAALAAGVQSLARGAGQRFAGGEVRQTIIEMDAALLFITAAVGGHLPGRAGRCRRRRRPRRLRDGHAGQARRPALVANPRSPAPQPPPGKPGR